MGYPKKHRGRRKQGSKKRRAKRKNKKKQLMDQINKAKSISIWIFIVPFVAVNACLIITTQFHSPIEMYYGINESEQYKLNNILPTQ